MIRACAVNDSRMNIPFVAYAPGLFRHSTPARVDVCRRPFTNVYVPVLRHLPKPVYAEFAFVNASDGDFNHG